jgi:hypothetical protein
MGQLPLQGKPGKADGSARGQPPQKPPPGQGRQYVRIKPLFAFFHCNFARVDSLENLDNTISHVTIEISI